MASIFSICDEFSRVGPVSHSSQFPREMDKSRHCFTSVEWPELMDTPSSEHAYLRDGGSLIFVICEDKESSRHLTGGVSSSVSEKPQVESWCSSCTHRAEICPAVMHSFTSHLTSELEFNACFCEVG